MEETQLVHRAMLGDAPALEALIEAYYPAILAFCCRRMGNPAQGADLCQDTFVKMVENLPRYKEQGRFKSWLFTIAANLCRDAFRKKRPQQELDDTLTDPTAGRFVQRTEDAALLRDAINALPGAQREAILLRYYHGFAPGDIARITRTPAPTVKTRLFRGMKKLREILGEAIILEA